MKLIRTFGPEAAAANELIAQLEGRGATNAAKVQPVVEGILADVRSNGMDAVLTYARRFDSLASAQPLRVTQQEMEQAWHQTAPELREAMTLARHNIRTFAQAQLSRDWMIDMPELKLGEKIGVVGQIIRPLARWAATFPAGVTRCHPHC